MEISFAIIQQRLKLEKEWNKRAREQGGKLTGERLAVKVELAQIWQKRTVYKGGDSCLIMRIQMLYSVLSARSK